MLLTDAYTFNGAHDYLPDVSAAQVTGTGYTAGGFTLSGVTYTYEPTTGVMTMDAADLLPGGLAVDARYAVVYYDTGVAGTSPLLSCTDLTEVDGEEVTVTGLAIHASGIVTLTLGPGVGSTGEGWDLAVEDAPTLGVGAGTGTAPGLLPITLLEDHTGLPLRLSVYTPERTFLAYLPRRSGVQGAVEHNATGAGQAQVRACWSPTRPCGSPATWWPCTTGTASSTPGSWNGTRRTWTTPAPSPGPRQAAETWACSTTRSSTPRGS